MKTMKWGLIGCGDISTKRVVPALNSLKECELVAVNRKNYEQAESYAKKAGARKWYNDYRDLVNDTEIDAVYVSTPVYVHAEQTIAAAEAGKHVLCEKPMAMNQKECDLMIKACRENDVKLGVSYYRHFYPLINRIKKALESGEIGKPVLADIDAFEWFDRKPGEPRYWLLEKDQAGGGPMMDFGCHRIEVLLNLFGEIDSLQSRIFNLYFEREVEDSAYVSILFKNRINATLRVSHATFEAQDTLTIHGTEGVLRIPELNKGEIIIKNADGEKSEIHSSCDNVHQPLIEDFVKAVRDDRDPAVNGFRARKVTRVLDHIYNNK